jgi:serine/threonine protein kinase
VLYEMATGRKAFDKPESVQTMSAIISDEPPPLDPRIPAPLRWTIDRCLAKEPAGRYESTRDLFHDLRGLRDHLSEASGAIPVTPFSFEPGGQRYPVWSPDGKAVAYAARSDQAAP